MSSSKVWCWGLAGGTCSKTLRCHSLASWPREVQGNITTHFIPQKLEYALASMGHFDPKQTFILTVLFGETMALTNSEEAMDAERMVSVLPRRNLRVEPVSYVGGVWLWRQKRDIRKWIMSYNSTQQLKSMKCVIHSVGVLNVCY